MIPQVAGEELNWSICTLRQMVTPPLPLAAVEQSPEGWTPGHETGSGLGDRGWAWVGSRFAAVRAALTALTTAVSQGRLEVDQTQPPQLAQAGTAAVRAPSRAA